jgi:DNA polymerase-1
MYRVLTDVREVREYLSGAKAVAFDFETSPAPTWRDDPRAALDPHKAHIVGASFSVVEDDAVYVPIHHMYGRNSAETDMLTLLSEVAADTSVVKIAHNLAFESAFLYAQGIVLQPPMYDTIAAAQMTLKNNTKFRTLSDSGLKTLASELFDADLPTYDAVTAGRYFDELDPDDPATVAYACADADFALRLYEIINAWFDKFLPKHRHIVERVESPTAAYCGIMRYNGLLVDQDRMRAMGERCERERVRLRSEIAFMIGDVNIGENASTSTFKKYLYDTLKLPILKMTAKYREAADEEALILLAEWCEANRPDLAPLFQMIQDYRRWGKIQSTYIDGYAKYINPATGRIHADLLPLATETGRFAARNPNLQNSPRIDNDDAGVRDFFIAPEGAVLLSLDFSQIELRVGAFYCRDEKMLKIYAKGGDIHAQTCAVIYHIPLDEASDKDSPLYKTRRTIAKNVNFGTFYGLFPRGLQRTLRFKAGLNTPLTECEQIIASLKAGYPKLARWQEETKNRVESRRYAETWLGRRRYIPDIISEDWGKKSFAERCAMNTPIQGTAADILKLAMGRILTGLPERPWLKPLLSIHDELVFEVHIDRIMDAMTFVRACMEAQPFPEFDVPIRAEAAAGKRFGELKEMEAIQ